MSCADGARFTDPLNWPPPPPRDALAADEPCCRNCSNWRPRALSEAAQVAHGEPLGTCRALPPRVLDVLEPYGVFPRMLASSWCAAFRRRASPR